jgi:hypothetical protein
MTTKLIETRRCFHCGEHGYLELPIEGIAKYEGGAFVQDAFPDLDRALREQIISGTHPECWNKMFGQINMDDGDDDPNGDGWVESQ